MPSVREHLIFKALAALGEVCDASREGPVRPSLLIRFNLAYLYAHGHGRRSAYDDFWKEMQDEHSASSDGGRYMRATSLNTCVQGIIADLGFNSTPKVMECLRNAHGKGASTAFWDDVQQQIDQRFPMPERRFRRD